MIKVRLYGSTLTFDSKEECRNYFLKGVAGSEGAERDRYSYILTEVSKGRTEIDSDME